jgi:Ca2+-binding RTX toxin-like protein
LGTDHLSNFQNLTGSAYNDTLYGDGGDNVLDGGGGINTLSYANAAAGVTVSLAIGAAQNTGGAGTDTVSNFQNLIGSAFNDTREGYGVLDGGGGVNTVTYAHALGAVNVSLALQGQAQSGNNSLSNFQNLTGSAHSGDTLEGDGGNNVLDGGGGFSDTVSYAHAASGVTVSLALQGSGQNTLGAGTDTLSNFQNLTGSAFNDTLEGDAGDNVLDGGAGINTVSYAHATAGVTVSLAGQGWVQNTVGAGNDTLTNFQNVIGSAYADTLTGATGTSSLTGGLGADTFKIASSAAKTAITDFSHAQGDQIDLTAITGITSFSQLTAEMGQSGADTVIDTGSGLLTLKNVTASSLAAGDFQFAAAPALPYYAYPYDAV